MIPGEKGNGGGEGQDGGGDFALKTMPKKGAVWAKHWQNSRKKGVFLKRDFGKLCRDYSGF